MNQFQCFLVLRSCQKKDDLREIVDRNQARRELSSIDTPSMIQVRWHLRWDGVNKKDQLVKLIATKVWVSTTSKGWREMAGHILSNAIFPVVRHWRWLRWIRQAAVLVVGGGMYRFKPLGNSSSKAYYLYKRNPPCLYEPGRIMSLVHGCQRKINIY